MIKPTNYSQRVIEPDLTTSVPIYANHATITKLTSLSRSHLYQLMAAGKIKTIALRKVGCNRGRRLFLVESVLEFLDNELSAQNPEQEPYMNPESLEESHSELKQGRLIAR